MVAGLLLKVGHVLKASLGSKDCATAVEREAASATGINLKIAIVA
jgi:hypothetical protein